MLAGYWDLSLTVLYFSLSPSRFMSFYYFDFFVSFFPFLPFSTNNNHFGVQQYDRCLSYNLMTCACNGIEFWTICCALICEYIKYSSMQHMQCYVEHIHRPICVCDFWVFRVFRHRKLWCKTQYAKWWKKNDSYPASKPLKIQQQFALYYLLLTTLVYYIHSPSTGFKCPEVCQF